MKRNRRQYKRTWAAAARTLKNIGASSFSDSDQDDSGFPEHVFGTEQFQNDQNESESGSEGQAGPSCQQNETSCPISSSNDKDTCLNVGGDTSCYSSDSQGETPTDSNLREGLVNWENQFLVKQNALDNLLMLLKQNGHRNFPSSARTLLQTSRNISIEMKSGMEYVYFNVSDQILKHFKQYLADAVAEIDSIQIFLNIDGLPLFKISGKSLWPVLCAIVNIK